MRRKKPGGGRRFRKTGPRKPKTFADLLAKHDPNEIYFNPDTGIQLIMEDNAPALAFGELLMKFYRANEGLNPIMFQLIEEPNAAIAQKDWYAIFYRAWHIRIVQGSSIAGPHQTQLWFKSESLKKNFWVATLQLMAFFFNEGEMRAALLAAIEAREFYMSDKDRDIVITV